MIVPLEGNTEIRFEGNLSVENKATFNTLKTYRESLIEDGYLLSGIVCDGEVLNVECAEGNTIVKTAEELTESGSILKLTNVIDFCNTIIE